MGSEMCIRDRIKTAESAAAVSRFASGVVIGSAIVDILGKCTSAEQTVSELEPYLTAIRNAID